MTDRKNALLNSAKIYEFPVVRHGFIEQTYYGKTLACSSEGCGSAIVNGGKLYVDTEARPNLPYCPACGAVKRFERKRELARRAE
jgi:hypothetical protein